MIRTVLARVRSAFAWASVPAHRRRVYKSARVVLPALVAAGFLSTGYAHDVLTVLAVLAGAAVPHLAAKHVAPARPKAARGVTKRRT